MNTVKRFWALCLDTHMKLALYKYAIIIIIIIIIMLRRGALLFLKVIRQISRSHHSKKRRIWPRLGVSGL